MTYLLIRLTALIQMALGIVFLFAPHWTLAAMGHSTIAPDIAYPLAMLAARFIAYGMGLWMAATSLQVHSLWIRLMALIQAIDLAAGIFLTSRGVVGLQLSAVPMFNATWIGVLCWFASSAPLRRQKDAS